MGWIYSFPLANAFHIARLGGFPLAVKLLPGVLGPSKLSASLGKSETQTMFTASRIPSQVGNVTKGLSNRLLGVSELQSSHELHRCANSSPES